MLAAVDYRACEQRIGARNGESLAMRKMNSIEVSCLSSSEVPSDGTDAAAGGGWIDYFGRAT